MARQPMVFELTMLCFLNQKKCSWPHSNRGYWTDGTSILLNGHLIAAWTRGAVHMYATAKWHTWLMAQAIIKIKEWCKREKVLAHPKQKLVCKEHTDCRENFKLGKACGQRFATTVTKEARML